MRTSSWRRAPCCTRHSMTSPSTCVTWPRAPVLMLDAGLVLVAQGRCSARSTSRRRPSRSMAFAGPTWQGRSWRGVLALGLRCAHGTILPAWPPIVSQALGARRASRPRTGLGGSGAGRDACLPGVGQAIAGALRLLFHFPGHGPVRPSEMMTNHTLSDFDFHLPDELIAQSLPPSAANPACWMAEATCRWTVSSTSCPGCWAGRPPGVQQHPGHQGPPVWAQGFWRACGSAGRAAAASGRRGLGAHLRASKSPKAGARLRLGMTSSGGFDAEVLGRYRTRWRAFPPPASRGLRWRCWTSMAMCRCRLYITHEDNDDDVKRYQTVWAAKPGAVAAPTARCISMKACWRRSRPVASIRQR